MLRRRRVWILMLQDTNGSIKFLPALGLIISLQLATASIFKDAHSFYSDDVKLVRHSYLLKKLDVKFQWIAWWQHGGSFTHNPVDCMAVVRFPST